MCRIVPQAARIAALPSLVAVGLTAPLVVRAYGVRRAWRYGLGFAAMVALEGALLVTLQHRAGEWRVTTADVVTLSRAAGGTVLLGLAGAGIKDRTGPAGWLGWLVVLAGATVSDWVDGPLARRAGPSALGGALDIEADSLLTLGAAAVAVSWGGLSRWCLLPPLLHYGHLVRSLRRGELPRGGGPWWGRLTGTAQMTLFLVALAPLGRRPPDQWLIRGAALISGGQGVAQVVLLAERR